MTPHLDHDALDECWSRLSHTGPERDGWLSNHGPMAADALIRLGHGDAAEAWVGRYSRLLHEAPAPRWRIEEDEWRDVLGDPSRLGDWCDLFARLLDDRPWRDVLVAWWPRLVDGAVASATHGLIRTGHAVRALLEEPEGRPSPVRVAELAQALGYWAARHQTLPGHDRPAGSLPPADALDGVHGLEVDGGIRARLRDLDADTRWPGQVAALRPVRSPVDVPAALDALVDAAVSRYERWAHGNPVMLVHAATAPRAAALVLPALPHELWVATHDAAWAASAAITAAYRPAVAGPPDGDEPTRLAADDVAAAAVATDDEHAIKFAEVALESHRRGAPRALAAAARSSDLLAG